MLFFLFIFFSFCNNASHPATHGHLRPGVRHAAGGDKGGETGQGEKEGVEGEKGCEREAETERVGERG